MLRKFELPGTRALSQANECGESYQITPEGRLTSRHSELVEARIEQHLGTAAGGMFEIVSAGWIAPGVQLAAILMDDHLPILIPVHDDEAGCVFMIEVYDIYGRRVPADGFTAGSAVKHHRLCDALAAAELGFRLLRHHSRTSYAQRFYNQRVGHLSEERWLHEQLCGSAVPTTAA